MFDKRMSDIMVHKNANINLMLSDRVSQRQLSVRKNKPVSTNRLIANSKCVLANKF